MGSPVDCVLLQLSFGMDNGAVFLQKSDLDFKASDLQSSGSKNRSSFSDFSLLSFESVGSLHKTGMRFQQNRHG